MLRISTFSWASVKGEIEFHSHDEVFAHTESVVPKFPHARALQHELCVALSGLIHRGRAFGRFTEDMTGDIPRRKGFLPLYDEEAYPFGWIYPDSTNDVDHTDVHCFRLGNQMYGATIFLVLVPVDEMNNTSITFRRIGLGQVGDADGFFFDGAEASTVHVV